MDNIDPDLIEFRKEEEFILNLRSNKLEIPNVFTIEMGQIIKKAREDKGWSQSQLAEELARRQATISDLENGKTEIGIFTLLQLSRVFQKPISFFIPPMRILASVNDVESKEEQEALLLFRELTYIGNSDLAIKILKLLVDHTSDEVDRMMNPEKYLE